jgi:hypothetical protein
MNTSASSSATQSLQRASDGLQFSSETDAPLTPFFWAAKNDPELTPELVAALAGAPEDAPVETDRLAAFFRDATLEEEWHNDEEKEQVRRFSALLDVIKSTLDGTKVFRIGETKIDVYIVGKVEGGFAGLHTQVVET